MADPKRPAWSPYRKICPLPPTVLGNVTVWLEEQLYPAAFSLLSASLSANTDSDAPAPLPPSQLIALAVTLIVHPQFTTRTTSQDKHLAANAALGYVRHLARSVDVTDGIMKEALCFQGVAGRVERSNRASRRRSVQASASDDEQDKPGHIRSLYVEKQALWNSAEDFWGVAGWAFNCSVRHKMRWERWCLWLKVMLDILERDLDSVAAGNGSVDIHSTLIVRYLATIGDGRNNKRRVMRAILADGSQKALAEFGEVWRDETKPPRTTKEEELRSSKRRKLDIENNEFGDYLDDSDEDSQDAGLQDSPFGSAPSGRRKRSSKKSDFVHRASDEDNEHEVTASSGGSQGIDTYGGLESIRLRQRLISLLTHLARVAPAVFMDTEELFSLFTEFFRPLPLAVFQQFVSPLRPYLSFDLQASLNEMIFQLLTGNVDKGSPEGITQAFFETNIAMQSATNANAQDTAKVSLLVESLLRGLWRVGMLDTCGDSLAESVRRGIDVREKKVRSDGRKTSEINAEILDEARCVMQTSAQRMLILINAG